MILLFVCSICANGFLFSQKELNLVKNSSFESVEGKVKKIGMIENALDWFSATGKPADLFVGGEKSVETSTAANLFGAEEPKDGKNYAGIVAYTFNSDKLQRSYIYSKLSTPLKKGNRYCVKFYVSFAEASKYSSNNIGAYFTKEINEIGEDKTYIVGNNAGVVLHASNDKESFNATFGWKEICGTFQAKGGESYIVIGNFEDDVKTRYEKVKKPANFENDQIIGAYYYIDDISVEVLEKNANCECMVEVKNKYSTLLVEKSIVITEKMSITEQIEIQQANFVFGKSNLSLAGTTSLDFIAQKMTENPQIKLEISGHSDSQEDSVATIEPEYADMDLNRINTAVLYLIEKGIDESRLMSSREGHAIPSEEIVETDDEEVRMAKCRRITFKVR